LSLINFIDIVAANAPDFFRILKLFLFCV